MPLQIIKAIEFREIYEKTKWDKQIEPIGNRLGGYKLCHGEFFKYCVANSTQQCIINELQFPQIFPQKVFTNNTHNAKVLTDCCIVSDLQKLGADKGLIDSVKRNTTDRFMKGSEVNKVCSDYKINLSLKQLNAEKHSKRQLIKEVHDFKSYIEQDVRCNLELYCFQNHFFANKCTSITSSWLEHWLLGEGISNISSDYKWEANCRQWKLIKSHSPLMLD